MKLSVRFHSYTEQTINELISLGFLPEVTIEIGGFEGDTCCNMVKFLAPVIPNYKHYVIDPFLPSENLTKEVVDEAKVLFLDNLKEFPQIEWLDKTSADGLVELYSRGVKADFIYVDGSHFAKNVLVDAVLGFEILNKNGIMLFDDAGAWRYTNNVTNSPKIAVDSFIHCNWDRLEILNLPNSWQVGIKKVVE